jgi:hypothetical protein
MTPNPENLSARATVAYVLNKMSVGGFRHVPVVDDEHRPVCVISVGDVVNFLVNAFPREVLNLPEPARRRRCRARAPSQRSAFPRQTLAMFGRRPTPTSSAMPRDAAHPAARVAAPERLALLPADEIDVEAALEFLDKHNRTRPPDRPPRSSTCSCARSSRARAAPGVKRFVKGGRLWAGAGST